MHDKDFDEKAFANYVGYKRLTKLPLIICSHHMLLYIVYRSRWCDHKCWARIVKFFIVMITLLFYRLHLA